MNLKDKVLDYGEIITNGTPGGILSGLYRTVLFDLGIEEARFENLVHKYVTRTERENPKADPKRDISSIRSTYVMELMSSEMTWKVFVKGLHVLNLSDCNIAIQVWFNDKDVETISVSTLVQLMKTKDKPADFETALSVLFAALMYKMDVTPARFGELSALYIKRSHVPTNTQDLANARGYLKKKLFDPKISWKVFIMSLLFLDVSQFVFVVQPRHLNGSITDHRRSITLDQDITDD